MDFLIMAAQLMLSLSILVVLHELGHFLPARWFGCRVEKFYLFFDPYFSLFKKQIGETEWGVGWLPLGGYVKISGMVDESMDMDQLAGPPQPWEFRSKPAWQRLTIMVGGVTVNFILGFLVFAGILFTWGRSYLPIANATDGIYADSLGYELGLRTGDRILRVDTVPIREFDNRLVTREILLNGARNIYVERNGTEALVTVPDSLQALLTERRYQELPLFTLPIRTVVDTVLGDSPAERAGLEKGDRIVSLGSRPTAYYQDLMPLLERSGDSPVELGVERGGERISLNATVNEDGKLGFGLQPVTDQYRFVTEDYSIAESIPLGVERGLSTLADQGRAIGQIFQKKIPASKSVGSFISIGRAFGATWDWQRFWTLTAMLSLILAVVNILPIPALDGGHVMFLLYEAVTGRKPSDKFLQVVTTGGFVLIIGLMLFALFNDIRNVL